MGDAPILSIEAKEGCSECAKPQSFLSPMGDHSGDELNGTSMPPRQLRTMVHHSFGEIMNDDSFVVGSRTSEHSENRWRTSTLFGYQAYPPQHYQHHHHHNNNNCCHGPGHLNHTQGSYQSNHSYHSVHSRNEGVIGHDEFIIRGSLEDPATTGY